MKMSLHRLFVPKEEICSPAPRLPPDTAAHLKVLRPKHGERFEMFDGAGSTRLCIYENGGVVPAGEVVRAAPDAADCGLWLFACVTKQSRWEIMLEKTVELGVTRIIPVISARSVVRFAPGEGEKKRLKWKKTVLEAARQSNALWLPEIAQPVAFGEALDEAREAVCFAGVIADPPHPPMAAAVMSARFNGRPAAFFTGPEGDFTPEETEALLSFAVPVSLGKSILRAETAAMLGVGLIAALRSAKPSAG